MARKKERRKASGSDKARAAVLYGVCRAVGWLPRWVLYGVVAPCLYVIVYRAARYRLGVVRGNLAHAFPGKNDRERRAIERRFYRHLAELFIDTVDFSSISPRQALRRITITNLAQHEAEVAGCDWIAAMSHYGSWEYFSAYQLLTQARVAGVYHPLADPAFDEFYKRVRTRFGMETVPMKSLMRYIIARRNEGPGRRPIAVGLIADHAPKTSADQPWVDFLHQPTQFLEGVGRLAVTFGMPVYFLHMRRVGTARYEARFERIYDGSAGVDPDQITLRYAALLQRAILECPPYWTWSHKRWKRLPAPGSNPVVHPLPEA